MAKKKPSHKPSDDNQENPEVQNPNLVQQQEQEQEHPPLAMELSVEKLQSLKSLNALLVKEGKERRQEVESLKEAKEALQSELSRSGEERSRLESELSRLDEENVRVEIENGVYCVFVEKQVSEMGVAVGELAREKREKENEVELLKSEVDGLMVSVEWERERLSRVCEERDLLTSDVENLMKEADGLREKVVEMEKKERKAEEEIGRLRVQCAALIKEKERREKEIEEMKRFRDLAEKNLSERVKEIGSLNREIEGIVKQKNDAEVERSGQKIRISELEKEVLELNESVLTMRKERVVLHEKVSELEKCWGEALEKEKTMAMEIDAMGTDKRENEKHIERLMEEKHLGEKMIKMLNADMEDKDGLVKKLLREKEEIEEVMVRKECEIVQLHKEVNGLRDAEFSLQESIKDQEGKNKELASEVGYYKVATVQVRLERDNAKKDLEKERETSGRLRSEIVEMEKRITENIEGLTKIKAEYEKMIAEKKDVECQISKLKNENDLVSKKLLEAEQAVDELRTRVKSDGTNLERALIMLKDTAALVCESTDERGKTVVTEKKLDSEIVAFATELEVVKNAFRDKDAMVDEMKQQVESLQKSVAAAQNKNTFWSTVSATAILAAASIAYIASAH